MKKLHYKESPSEKDKKAFAPFLSEDEDLILVTGFSKIHLRSKFIIALLLPGGIPLLIGLGLAYLFEFNLGIGLMLGLIGAILVAILRVMWSYHANRYLLTTRRVVIKKGLFAVKLTSAMYDKITHLEVDQSFIERALMHHGKIIINTAGLNKGEIILSFVEAPLELKNLLERLINREREQFGLRGGSVTAVEGEVL